MQVATSLFVAFTIYSSRRSATNWTLQGQLLGTDSGNTLFLFYILDTNSSRNHSSVFLSLAS
jgi:hypothetical protein